MPEAGQRAPMISQMSIDRPGLARAAALLAAGLHTLDHQQPSGGQRPRQPDPIALGAVTGTPAKPMP
jgi:hypothetical protein